MFGITNNEEGGKYIRSCNVEEITFLGVKAVTVGDSNAIEVTMCVKGEEENKNEQKFNLFFTEKSQGIANSQIKAWLNRTCSQEYFDLHFKDKSFASLDEYAAAINAALKGKSMRQLFGGREYLNKENEVKVAPTLVAYDSNEAIIPGCVKPVVEKENSTLRFDKTSQYHYKALEGAPATSNTMVTANPEVDDDLPF